MIFLFFKILNIISLVATSKFDVDSSRSKISEFAKDNSLGGLEFLSCIPGSIGGAVIMNSGCYENDISKILI